MPTHFTQHPASYRDPAGFVFVRDGVVYRQVNKIFEEAFKQFISSGCYDKLIAKKLLVSHETVNQNISGIPGGEITLKPSPIPFISYPYEWCFDMLKDAALHTLEVLKTSIACGMILKDASPYNIQWLDGKPIFIDTLSFEKYSEEQPWIAYRQFCENFLGPLLLMHYRQVPLSPMLLSWPEGIPLAVIRALIPWRSRLSLHTWLHIHMHAKIAAKAETATRQRKPFSKKKLNDLITSLEIVIRGTALKNRATNWTTYYDEASGRDQYLQHKKQIVQKWILNQEIKTAVDLGANEGLFSEMLAKKNIFTIATDSDNTVVNRLYNIIKTKRERHILPLILDLANPSPSIGFNSEERASFVSRLNTDLALALAIVHHLAIGKNIPLRNIALFIHGISNRLIIEFVPKSDEKVVQMLQGKEDIYAEYTRENFEHAFSGLYTILKKEEIAGSERILYLMQKA